MKLFVSLFLGSAALTSAFWTSPANAAWYTEYQCGSYRIGIRETGRGNEYAYREEGPEGRLELSDGRKEMGDKSWIYSFQAGNKTVMVEDKWGTGRNEPDSAFFEIIEFSEAQNRGFRTANQSCTKTDYGFN